MDKAKKAINKFNSGFNCAQSVLTPFLSDLKMDKATALRLSAGFGAGMGRRQETCGALTGAYMVLGMKYGEEEPDDNSKEKVIELIQDFTREFSALNKQTSCRELLQVDLNTEEGQKTFEETKLHENVCEKCVASSVELLRKVMEENG